MKQVCLAQREIEHVETLDIHPADEASQGIDSADEHDCSTDSVSTTDSLSLSFLRTRVLVTELSKILNQPTPAPKSKVNKLSSHFHY